MQLLPRQRNHRSLISNPWRFTGVEAGSLAVDLKIVSVKSVQTWITGVVACVVKHGKIFGNVYLVF